MALDMAVDFKNFDGVYGGVKVENGAATPNNGTIFSGDKKAAVLVQDLIVTIQKQDEQIKNLQVAGSTLATKVIELFGNSALTSTTPTPTKTDDKTVEETKTGDKAVEETKTGDKAVEETKTGDKTVEETKTGDKTVEETKTGDKTVEETKTDKTEENQPAGFFASVLRLPCTLANLVIKAVAGFFNFVTCYKFVTAEKQDIVKDDKIAEKTDNQVEKKEEK